MQLGGCIVWLAVDNLTEPINDLIDFFRCDSSNSLAETLLR